MRSYLLAGVCLGLMLSGCGGGGGGGDNNNGGMPPPPMPPQFDDGLGASGQAMGTVAVSNGIPASTPVAALDDLGRALIVWPNFSSGTPQAADQTYFSARSDSNRNWLPPEPLPNVQTSDSLPVLRSNGAGDAVLSWFQSGSNSFTSSLQLRRFDPDQGWFEVPGTAGATDRAPFFRGDGDDPLLPDGTFTLATFSVPASPIGISPKMVRVFTQQGAAPFTLAYESAPFDNLGDAFLEPVVGSASQRLADLYFVDFDVATPARSRLQFVPLDLQATTNPSPRPVLLFDQGSLCGSGFAFGSSISTVKTAALQGSRTQDTDCTLDLVRLPTVLSEPTVQRVTPDDAGASPFAFRTPKLFMDGRGNTLAVWIVKDQPVWSQSLAGGPWSTPQPLLSESAGFGSPFLAGQFPFGLALAMNQNGQTVAIIKTRQAGQTYLVRARFSFESGWSDLARILRFSEREVTDPEGTFDVAINASGDALAAYLLTRGSRMIFALRF